MQDNVKNQVRRKVKRIPLFKDEPQTLAELFIYAKENHSRNDALNYKNNGKWQSISTETLIVRSQNIALGLYSLGVKKGNRVAILSANSPNWTIADAGCQFAGIIDVPIYTTLVPNSIQYILNDSGAKVAFLQDKKAFEYIKEILPKCESLEKIILFDFEEVDSDDVISLSELEATGKKLKEDKPDLINDLVKAVKPKDIATLIYTSGTTGEPKGVMLSNENLVSNVIDIGEGYNFTKKDTPLSVLPLSHVFERTGMYLYIFHGMSVHYAESIEKIPVNLQEVRPTIFVGVPRIFEKVYGKAKLKAASESPTKEKIFDWAIDVGKEIAYKKEKGQPISRILGIKHTIADKIVFSKLRDFFGGNLRFCITGGAALSNSIYLIFTGARISIMQGYGFNRNISSYYFKQFNKF